MVAAAHPGGDVAADTVAVGEVELGEGVGVSGLRHAQQRHCVGVDQSARHGGAGSP